MDNQVVEIIARFPALIIALLRAGPLDDHVAEIVENFPGLTDEQRQAIVALFFQAGL